MVERFFNFWLALAGLGLVLYFLFSDTRKTNKLITALGSANADFITTLQGRQPAGGYYGPYS